MKKLFLTLFVVILMTINASAQYKAFQFGLNISPSVNITKPNSDNLIQGKNQLSYSWGFNGNFYFVENYGFSTGFNVRNISGNYIYNHNTLGDISCSITNQYLEIPLSLIMRTERIGEMRVVGNIGYGPGNVLCYPGRYHGHERRLYPSGIQRSSGCGNSFHKNTQRTDYQIRYRIQRIQIKLFDSSGCIQQ